MKSLIEKSSGKVLGFWPSGQDVSVSGFDPALHEWDESAPEDVVIEDVPLYTKGVGGYVKGKKVDEKALLKAEILAELDASVDTKIAFAKLDVK